MVQLALTVAEAAEASRIGRTALYQAIARQELPVVRIGRRIVITCEALEEFLRSRSATAAPASQPVAEAS